MTNPTAAMLVIGDEILSGRTQDCNTQVLAQKLSAHGIDLKEARVVADDPDAIIHTVRTLSGEYDYVFTSGGIGPTHDDITADCIAKAFGLAIDIRQDARDLLEARAAKLERELSEASLRMARIPDGASLIENEVSAAPGFIVENVHVLAGVPSVFNAMVNAVLPKLRKGAVTLSRTIRIDRGESAIAPGLKSLSQQYDTLSFGSYPFSENGLYGTNIVIRGTDEDLLKKAENAVTILKNEPHD